MVDHLSRLLNKEVSKGDKIPLNESFLDEQLLQITKLPWFADLVNYKVCGEFPLHFTNQDKRMVHMARFHY